MKKVYLSLFLLHSFIGAGGVFGGFSAIQNPQAPMGAPVDLLKNSPFANYLIPGIILFSVIGLGNLISAVLNRLKYRYQAYTSSIFSCALVIWIAVQCIMLRTIAAQQVITLIFGIAMTVLSGLILWKQKLFPVNAVISVFNKNQNKSSGIL